MTNKDLNRLVLEYVRAVAPESDMNVFKFLFGELTALIDIEKCDQKRLTDLVAEMEEELDPENY
jgi:hypothetical protein